MTSLKQRALDGLEVLYTESVIAKEEYDLIAAALHEDAAPVVHGRWAVVTTYGKTALYRCTACKTEMVDYIGREDYHHHCHSCGARMDGGEDDG